MPKPRRTSKRPSPVDVALGRNVRIWRIDRGMSQADLAKRLGVTFQQLQKYEVGNNRMSTGRLVKAAAILDVPVSAFFDGIDDRAPVQALLADKRAFRLAQAFAAIKNNVMRLSLVYLVEKVAASVPAEKRGRRNSATRRARRH